MCRRKNVGLCFLVSFLAFFSAPVVWCADETLLLREPTVSAEQIVFVYARDLWIVGREGGDAKRLTVHPGMESNPSFSPDGQSIAFTGNYDGNTDVYVIPVEGGSPARLTYHPGGDVVRGWTPDGKQILFRSTRYSTTGRYGRLFTVAAEGGFPEMLPMPMAESGSFSPDGSHIAYSPLRDAFSTWKRYRGGRMAKIWLFDMETHKIEEIPRDRSNDCNPMWLDEEVYFLSDRNRTMNLFAYSPDSKSVRQVTEHSDFDVKRASAGGGVIVYEQGGRLHLYDPSDGSARPIKIRVAADLPEARSHYEKGTSYIYSSDISPTGKRVLMEVRGDIFTVPAEKGDIRNLTRTPGVNERFPSWSPDGKWIVYLSDESGEYQLVLRDPKGEDDPVDISLGDPTFYYSPNWSPDSKKLVYTDKRLNLFYLDVEDRKTFLVDTDTYDHPERSLDPCWSPDSRWIVYAKRLDHHLRAVFLYNLETAENHQISDGMSDCTSPCFSRDGKYLFFGASTDFGLNTGWLDLTSSERPVRRNLYLAVLSKDEPSPFAPESDEEEIKEEKEENEKKDEKKPEEDSDDEEEKNNDEKEEGDKKDKEEVEVTIDLDGLDQRILALPLPSLTYTDGSSAASGKSIQTAAEGKVFYLEQVPSSGFTLKCFDMKERKSETFLEKVNWYLVSHDGKKLLYTSEGDTYAIVETGKKPEKDDGKLDLSKMQVYVDPRAEWAQMFEEVWRIERDYFYAPNMHGADWAAVREKYRPFLDHVGHRDDLNYIFAEMFGELVVGHAYVSGGDMPDTERVNVGLLGADFEIVGGYYRIKKIYDGENWNPDLRAPLTEPGVNVSEGDYILAVDGRSLRTPDNLYGFFENTAGKQTVLKVYAEPVLEDATSVIVVPVSSETGLRNRDWVESNRRKVDEMSDGRVAYVYLPNTARAGYTYFNRYYFSQLDRDAAVIDERFNGGGQVADYVLDLLNRPLLSYWATREGKAFKTPNAAIHGPKAMIINAYAGSGGDFLPMAFRRRGLGKLVGETTWGGLVGIYDYPVLMDKGRVTAPRMAIFSPDGEWEVENIGVPPDIEVEMTPKLVIEGHDPQLEKAVEVVLEELERNPPKKPPVPAYPDRVH